MLYTWEPYECLPIPFELELLLMDTVTKSLIKEE